MKNIPYSAQQLWKVLEFLATKEGQPVERFVSQILLDLKLREEKLNELANKFLNLDADEKSILLSKLGCVSSTPENKLLVPPSLPRIQSEVQPQTQIYSIQDLMKKTVQDLIRSKPTKLWINQIPFDVKSWKEVSITFVQTLISQKLLRKEQLPFYPSKKSRKAYVNFFPGQPNGVNAGLFVEISSGFYVDIKFNAKYHILNIWRSMESLLLLDKWNIELELKGL